VEAREAQHSPDEAFVEQLLHPETPAYDYGADAIKVYVDKVERDPQVEVLYGAPAELVRLHEGMTALVTNNVALQTTGLNERGTAYMDGQLQAYKTQLQQDNEAWVGLVERMGKGERVRQELSQTGQYSGLIIPTQAGPLDLADVRHRMPNVGVNMQVQNAGVEVFVHWSTDAKVAATLDGTPPELTRRIYLNPRLEDRIAVFTEIMQGLNEDQTSASGKVLDPSFGPVWQTEVRGDGIVLYVGREQADRVLERVLEMAAARPDAFQDRPLPKVPMQVAPGIAIGDDPGSAAGEGGSLSSHRAKVLAAAIQETRQLLFEGPRTPSAEPIAVFWQVWEKLAAQNDIDPNNWAFNKKVG
jgi:hypothetical protein